jgi:hypothetical protein
MAKQANGRGQEKKLRKQLQQAESAHMKAQQQLEKAQATLAKAEARLERRTVRLAEARAALTTLVTSPAATTASDVSASDISGLSAAGDGEVASGRGRAAKRGRKGSADASTDTRGAEAPSDADEAIEERAAAAGIVVP